MAAMQVLSFCLGLVILLAPVVFHGLRSGMFSSFSLKRLRRTLDHSILFQGGFALITVYPTYVLVFAGMGGYPGRPVLEVVAGILFWYYWLFWIYYAPAVVVFKVVGLVTDRMQKRRDEVSGGNDQ
jgi:hypothetical protein